MTEAIHKSAWLLAVIFVDVYLCFTSLVVLSGSDWQWVVGGFPRQPREPIGSPPYTASLISILSPPSHSMVSVDGNASGVGCL